MLPPMAELKLTLEALQRCEAEVEALRRESEQLPSEIAACESRAEAARRLIADEHSRLEQAEHTRREREAELADCEARLEKYRGQTVQVKTNEEYTALLAEMEAVQARISDLEEEILLAMETVDEVRGGLAAVEAREQAEEREALRGAEAARQRLSEVESDLEAHHKELERLSESLIPEARNAYQRALRSRGPGTALVAGRTCSACHRDLPYETVNRAIAGELRVCDNCKRVLVVIGE